MEIKRIKVKEYLQLIDKSAYNFAINYAEEFHLNKDCLGIGDIGELTFELIKDFQSDLEDGSLTFEKQINYLKRILSEAVINNSYLNDLCNTIIYLTSGIVKMLEIESEVLGGEPSPEEEAAGLNRFELLGTYLQYRQLADNDITKIKEIKKMTYNECFLELYTRKQESDFQRDLQRIYNNKMK